MNIAHVISGLATASGPTTFCVRAVDHLATRGEAVSLYVEEIEPDAELPDSKEVSVYEFGSRLRLVGFCDVMHIHALWILSSHRAAVLAQKKSIPYVFSTHGMLAPWSLSHKRWKKMIAWWLYQHRDLKHAAMFHVTAPCEIQWLWELGFTQPCMLAPLGADLPGLECIAIKSHSVHRILFVGRVYPVKGLVNLVQAFARLKNAGRIPAPWQVVVAGPDQAGHMGELIALAQKSGLTVANLSEVSAAEKISVVEQSPADIVFTGGVYGEIKDALHRLADLFVLTSFSENFGVVVADALAYGLPVIATQGTPWQELESKECGWWIPIGDEPLAGALHAAMLLGEKERHAMGVRGRQLVEAKYTWPSIARQMSEAYAWLLHRGIKPDSVFLD